MQHKIKVEYAGKIEKLQIDVRNLIDENKRLTEENDQLTEENLKIYEELKAEQENKEFAHCKLKALDKFHNAFIVNNKLELDLSLETDYLKLFSLSLFKLPNLKRISLQKLKEADENILSFFKNSVPNSLELLNLGYDYERYINMKFYLEGVTRLILNTTVEVSFEAFNMDKDDLSQIVRACRNSRRIKLWRIVLDDTKGKLDFGTDLSYQTKYLSIESGSQNMNYLKFNAIQESSLKDSLELIDVYHGTRLKCGNIKIGDAGDYHLTD